MITFLNDLLSETTKGLHLASSIATVVVPGHQRREYLPAVWRVNNRVLCTRKMPTKGPSGSGQIYHLYVSAPEAAATSFAAFNPARLGRMLMLLSAIGVK